MAFDRVLDARGLKCPEPLMRLRHEVRAMSAGQTVQVTATDPSTERDFADFCRFLGHELVACEHGTDHLTFVIRKGGA